MLISSLATVDSLEQRAARETLSTHAFSLLSGPPETSCSQSSQGNVCIHSPCRIHLIPTALESHVLSSLHGGRSMRKPWLSRDPRIFSQALEQRWQVLEQCLVKSVLLGWCGRRRACLPTLCSLKSRDVSLWVSRPTKCRD